MKWWALRNKWLGNPANRARLARWPVFRRISAHHARRLFGIVAGFSQSQMLAAAIELGVFDALRHEARAWEGLTDLPPAGAEALRQALLAMGIVEERHGQLALTIDGVVIASDPAIRTMIAHNQLLYADLADPVATLRRTGAGRIAAFWPYAGSGDPAAYSALMHASHTMVSDMLCDHPALAQASHVMDVGGGYGALLLALRARYTDLRLTLVDLPGVVSGLDLTAHRIGICALEPDAPLPMGADTAVLMRVLHDQDDADAQALLARVAASLPSGGQVIIAEPMTSQGRDPQSGYFAAYFAAMRSGRLRSPADVTALLAGAGFNSVRQRTMGPLMHIIIARTK